MKNILYTILITIIALSSCRKKVTDKKLDWEWTLSSVSGEEENVFYGGEVDSYAYSYDGKNYVTVYKSGNSKAEEVKINYSFDQKSGTYLIETDKPTAYYETNNIECYILDSNGGYSLIGQFKKVTKKGSNEVEEGTFSIPTSSTGDVKKKSQLILFQENKTQTINYNYEYYKGDSLICSLTGYYIKPNYGGLIFKPLVSSEVKTYVDTYNFFSKVFNVESIKRNEIKLNYEESYVYGEHFLFNFEYVFESKSIKMDYVLKRK